MPFQPTPPVPPVLPASPLARRRLEQLAAAHGGGPRRAALVRAPWLPAAAAEALALMDDPGFRRLAAGFRALEARRGAAPAMPEPPRGLQALLGRLAGRYPLAFAALRAGLAEERGPDGNNVISMVVVPSLIFYVVLVPTTGWQQQGRCFLEALARLVPQEHREISG